ncbi:PREDICTED: ovarian cancer G-protein coupled receptor 1-like [Poecilia mexicana]|uniref:ovarian cancer G-protein coupled receptor 1-like n=1 Tax=Poecilia mexicana TaxID=48701 RepID=UPI00072DB279|nr:PREDICTED: ovarian cancer G-protein coupled receptor 1-like [Poecilia mexicana]
MEDSHISRTSGDENLNQNIFNHSDASNRTDNRYMNEFSLVVNWITVAIGFPLTLAALWAVLIMVKNDHGAPVYIFNLLLSDVIQYCSRITMKTQNNSVFASFALSFGLAASIGFMMCVSLERYLVVAKPLWYRFRRNIQTSVLVCVAVWIFSLSFTLSIYLFLKYQMRVIIQAAGLLLPLLLFIFCLVGTIKALSEARSVSAEEKRLIVSILVVVLLIYVLLFLPFIMYFLLVKPWENVAFFTVGEIGLFLSPLADSALYIFLRKTEFNQLGASLCCCVTSQNQEISSTDDINMSAFH